MIENILAAVTEVATTPPVATAPPPSGPSDFMLFLPALTGIAAYVFIFMLIIICLIRLVKYLGIAKNEQKLMRMELGKLAEEVRLIREDIKGSNPGGSE